ncbi:MAG: 5-formyltetrahydrofolate cyclo-ligase [Oscillospiraceae bacterium]|nr:5-formyltetrahydrofolate cyclo-ligase [Oscillospiraceae bacterium]
MKKFELRQKLLQNRKPCPEKDSLILKNLLSLKEFKEADLLLTYISTEKEVDTRALIKKCFELNKRVAVPLSGVHEIAFYEINSLSDTEEGKFGIREPLKTQKKAQISNKTFCVVPALACNEKGFRLGYGKGYYDRFLAEFNGTSAVLCYSENIIEIPTEPHDHAVDMIITEGGIAYGRQDRRIRVG